MLSLIRTFALGLWVGALAAFAFIFAPVAFAHVGPTPAFAATIARSVILLTASGYVCAALAALTSLAELRRAPARAIAIIALVVSACVLGFYEVHAIVPAMQSTPLRTPAYDALHHRSSTVYSFILLAAAIALGTSAWQSSARR